MAHQIVVIHGAQRPRSPAPSEARAGRARRARPVRWSALLGLTLSKVYDHDLASASVLELFSEDFPVTAPDRRPISLRLWANDVVLMEFTLNLAGLFRPSAMGKGHLQCARLCAL